MKSIKYQLNIIFNTPILLYSIFIILGIISASLNFLIISLLLLFFIKKKFALLTITSFILGFLVSFIFLENLSHDERVLANFHYKGTASIEEPIENSPFTSTLVLKIKEVNALVVAEIPRNYELKYQDKIEIEAIIKNISEGKEYLKKEKLYYETENLIIINKLQSPFFINVLQKTRSYIEDTINRNTVEPYSSLLLGIIIGEKVNLDESFKDKLITSGTSHIISASGFNLMILYLALNYLKGILKNKVILILGVLLVGFNLMIIGTYVLPAERAAIMILFLIIGNLSGRKVNYLAAINLSVIIILLQYPLAYKNVSFQLSIGATLGLFIFSPIIKQQLKRFPAMLKDILSSSLGVIIATMPISILTFQSLSLISTVSNVLILPFISGLTYLGIIGITLSILKIDKLTQIIFIMTQSLLSYIDTVIEFLGSKTYFYTSDLKVIFIILIFIAGVISLKFYLTSKAHE